MRRFEYLGDGLKEFWLIWHRGMSVTTWFGPIGTDGQTSTERFASDAAARQYVDKLVAERLTEGYTEVPFPPVITDDPRLSLSEARGGSVGSGDQPSVELPDEDTFRPEEWRDVRHRGGVVPSMDRGRMPYEAASRILDSPDSDRYVAAQARAYLQGVASPMGAAAVAIAVPYATYDLAVRDHIAIVADDWVAAHGMVFAARAAVELAGLAVCGRNPQHHVCRWSAAGDERWWGWSWPVVDRVRVHLAAANDDDYRAVCDALAGYRSGIERQRITTSYLVPMQTAWVDEDYASGDPLGSLLFHCVTTVEQDRRLKAQGHPPALGWEMRLIEAVGPGAAREVAHDPRLLAKLPTDEAFQLLLDQHLTRADEGHENRPAALSYATARYPVRTLRLLSAAATDPARTAAVTALLETHVLSNPALVVAALAVLPATTRQHVKTLIGSYAVVDDAPATLLPSVLTSPVQAAKGRSRTRMPQLPAWAHPQLLPPVFLRDRTHVLPDDAVRNLCLMLARSRPDAAHPDLRAVTHACDTRSLADLGWALVRRWDQSGRESKDGWILPTLVWISGQDTVERLVPLIRRWAADGERAWVTRGLDVLVAIGTDTALRHLHQLSERGSSGYVKKQARRRVSEVAAARGLGAEELADRLVPALGLDPHGSVALDYGPRRFSVGLNEQLKPCVADERGKPLTTLPKPGARDDPERAAAAYQRFAALKKELRTVAPVQIHRLEHAMVSGRRWTGMQGRDLFVTHPLLGQLARRLVWATFDGAGNPTATLRIAEDRTYADVHDDPLTVDDDSVVGIAHPVHLGDTVGDWSEVFTTYEILQPFPQLARGAFVLTDEERHSTNLRRFEGHTVPTVNLLNVGRRGWEREPNYPGALQTRMRRHTYGGWTVVVDFQPGIDVGFADEGSAQELTEVRIEGDHRFGDLDPVTASEILRDLTDVAG